MQTREIKRIPKDDIKRREDNERSLEVRFMFLLIEKYPDKAKEKVKDLKAVMI